MLKNKKTLSINLFDFMDKVCNLKGVAIFISKK